MLLTVASVAAVLGWALAQLVDSLIGRYLPISWTAAGAIWLLALALLMWGWVVRPRLLHRPGSLRLVPHVAARTAALALASSRTGAAVFGVYLGFSVSFMGELATPAGQESAIISAVAATGGVALAAVALWLERLCRIDDDQDSNMGDPTIRSQDLSGE